MAVFGYVRTSTARQDPQRQVRNVLAYDATAEIIQETYTGRSVERPHFQRLLKRLKSGDVLVCDSISRFARDAESGAALYVELYERGVELVFLNERVCDSANYRTALERAANLPEFGKVGDTVTDAFLDTMHAAVQGLLMGLARRQFETCFAQAETEARDLRERTRQGIQTARDAGKQVGRAQGDKLTTQKSIRCKKLILEHNRTFGGTLNDEQTRQLCGGIARNTLYRYKRQLLQEQGE